jgi:hypothetical protein
MAREPGFYWVRLKGNDPSTGKPFEWEVAQWFRGGYLQEMIWALTWLEDQYQDNEFAEIDERKINRET